MRKNNEGKYYGLIDKIEILPCSSGTFKFRIETNFFNSSEAHKFFEMLMKDIDAPLSVRANHD